MWDLNYKYKIHREIIQWMPVIRTPLLGTAYSVLITGINYMDNAEMVRLFEKGNSSNYRFRK